ARSCEDATRVAAQLARKSCLTTFASLTAPTAVGQNEATPSDRRRFEDDHASGSAAATSAARARDAGTTAATRCVDLSIYFDSRARDQVHDAATGTFAASGRGTSQTTGCAPSSI